MPRKQNPKSISAHDEQMRLLWDEVETLPPDEKQWLLADPDLGNMFHSDGKVLNADEFCRIIREKQEFQLFLNSHILQMLHILCWIIFLVRLLLLSRYTQQTFYF